MSGDTIELLKETLEDVADSGEAECRVCGQMVEGESFGEILEKLGEHGEKEHPEVVR